MNSVDFLNRTQAELKAIIEHNDISVAQLAKDTGIPYNRLRFAFYTTPLTGEELQTLSTHLFFYEQKQKWSHAEAILKDALRTPQTLEDLVQYANANNISKELVYSFVAEPYIKTKNEVYWIE